MKKLAALFLAVVMLFALVACGQQAAPAAEAPAAEAPAAEAPAAEPVSGEKVTLTVTSWFTAENQGQVYMDAWQQAADELGYEIILDATNAEDFKVKEKIQMSSGETSDIYTMWSALNHMQDWVSSGSCISVDKYIDSADFKFVQAQLNPYYADGKNYIFPVTTGNPYVLFYNKELVDQLGLEVPKTYEDMLHCIDVCKAAGLDAFGLPTKDRWMADFLFMAMLDREDPTAWSKIQNGEAKFTDEPYLNTAKRAQELVKAGAFPEDALNIDSASIREMFFAGRFPFFTEGTYRWNALYETMGDNLGYAPMPMTGSSTAYTESCMSNTGFGLIISTNCKHPDEAAKLCLKYSQIIGEDLAKKGRMNIIETDTQPEGEVAPAYQDLLRDLGLVKTKTPAWSDNFSSEGCSTSYDLAQALFSLAITPEEYCEQYQALLESEGF